MKIVNPIGKKGEDIAVEYLQKKGYKILERNYRKQYAEIDIIAVDPGKDFLTHFVDSGKNSWTLVFIEVKTRTSNAFGTPFEAITPWKLRPVTKLAEYYAISHKSLPEQMRIDAIAVTMDEYSGVNAVEHMENISEF